jgi:hypothetical protein
MAMLCMEENKLVDSPLRAQHTTLLFPLDEACEVYMEFSLSNRRRINLLRLVEKQKSKKSK